MFFFETNSILSKKERWWAKKEKKEIDGDQNYPPFSSRCLDETHFARGNVSLAWTAKQDSFVSSHKARTSFLCFFGNSFDHLKFENYRRTLVFLSKGPFCLLQERKCVNTSYQTNSWWCHWQAPVKEVTWVKKRCSEAFSAQSVLCNFSQIICSEATASLLLPTISANSSAVQCVHERKKTGWRRFFWGHRP